MPTKRPPPSSSQPASILDLAYERASKSVDKPLVRDSRAVSDIEFVCRCSQSGGNTLSSGVPCGEVLRPDVRHPQAIY